MAIQSNRQSYFPTISPDPTPAEIALHLRNLYGAANDHDQAIAAVNGKVGTAMTTITKVTTVSSGGGGGSTPPPPPSGIPSLGGVNNQQGATSYHTQQSDNGAKVIVGAATPVSVVLNSGVTTPWFTTIDNDGTAAANLSASSGTLFGEQSIQPGGFGIVYFDGTTFFCGATGVSPQNKPSVAHQFFTAFSSTTGTFSAAQPAFSDISGQITTSQLPASGITATIATAKLTTGGTNGSMQFQNGILVAQTPAT